MNIQIFEDQTVAAPCCMLGLQRRATKSVRREEQQNNHLAAMSMRPAKAFGWRCASWPIA